MTPVMTLQHARAVRHNPDDASRLELIEALVIAFDALARTEAELDRVEAHSLDQERLRTLGGIPPVPSSTWGNVHQPREVHLDYRRLA